MDITFDEIKSLTIYSFEDPFDPKNITSHRKENILKVIQTPELQALFKHVQYKKKNPLWKTAIPATIDYANGNKLFITISSYGSFFVVAGRNGYFYFADDASINKWNSLIWGKNR